MGLLGDTLKSCKHGTELQQAVFTVKYLFPIHCPLLLPLFFLNYRVAPHTIFSFPFWYNE